MKRGPCLFRNTTTRVLLHRTFVRPRYQRGGAGDFGTVSGAFFECLRGVPVTAVLGDQHAASFGQCCFREGDTKATFGTGCFVMRN